MPDEKLVNASDGALEGADYPGMVRGRGLANDDVLAVVLFCCVSRTI